MTDLPPSGRQPVGASRVVGLPLASLMPRRRGCLFEEALQVDLFHNKGVSMERAVQARIRPWIEKDSRQLDNALAAGVVELDHDRVALKNKMAKACREGSWSTVTMPSCRPSDDAPVPETGI